MEKGNTMTRKIIIGVTAALFALTASACNTVRGAGEDLESVANDVDQAI
jgi:entericidin B